MSTKTKVDVLAELDRRIERCQVTAPTYADVLRAEAAALRLRGQWMLSEGRGDASPTYAELAAEYECMAAEEEAGEKENAA